MNVERLDDDTETVTVRMPEAMVAGVDELRREGDYDDAGEVVAAAIRAAASDDE